MVGNQPGAASFQLFVLLLRREKRSFLLVLFGRRREHGGRSGSLVEARDRACSYSDGKETNVSQ